MAVRCFYPGYVKKDKETPVNMLIYPEKSRISSHFGK